MYATDVGGAMKARIARLRRHRRWLVRGTAAILVIVVGPIATTACAVSSGGKGIQAESVHVKRGRSGEEVALLPIMVRAGAGGWCLTTVAAGGATCPTFHLPASSGPFEGPIVVEHWSGHSSSSEVAVNDAVVLTESDVAAVSLEGRAPVVTRASPLLPGGLRAVYVELASPTVGHGVAAPPPFPGSHFVALNSSGQQMSQTRLPGVPLEFRVPSQNWEQAQKAPRGVCRLVVKLAGLAFEGGSVMTATKPHTDVRGREFVDCLRATYLFGGWPVEVNVLLDASHPGSRPASLPGTEPIIDHAGVFQWPGARGEMVAQRMGAAWLIVGQGGALRQRLMVLEHLSPTIGVH
jgi:hypothetical protein